MRNCETHTKYANNVTVMTTKGEATGVTYDSKHAGSLIMEKGNSLKVGDVIDITINHNTGRILTLKNAKITFKDKDCYSFKAEDAIRELGESS